MIAQGSGDHIGVGAVQSAGEAPLRQEIGGDRDAPDAPGAAVVIALIVVNAFSMVIGELIPKNATLSDPMRAAGLVAQGAVEVSIAGVYPFEAEAVRDAYTELRKGHVRGKLVVDVS